MEDTDLNTDYDVLGDDLPQPEPDERPADCPLYRAVLGTAGTGKTFLMRAEAEKYDDVVLCATTGIAAINLGGVTINSLLWYGTTDDLRTSYALGRVHAAIRKIADSRYNQIVLDEMSMMDGEQLDLLVNAFDEVNAPRIDQGKRPLGLTLVGDFCQLPPVGWGDKKPRVDQFNRPKPPIHFVFERPSWARFEPHITRLTEPRRQADAEFIRALQAVRRGDALTAMNYFQSRLDPVADSHFDGATILAKNDEVDRFNAMRMMELPSDPVQFPATRKGEQLSEWKNIPEVLTLKRDALVMILVNKRYPQDQDADPAAAEMIYANGDLAYFIEKTPVGGARVRLKRTGQEVVIPMLTREKTKATGRAGVKAPREDVLGSIQYMPLRVAYATTVHKSQGLSLDTVQVMFSNHFFTHPGMLYVALSRARSPEGLRLVGTLRSFVERCRTNPAVAKWL